MICNEAECYANNVGEEIEQFWRTIWRESLSHLNSGAEKHQEGSKYKDTQWVG
jgi:hypothetical protein